MKHIFATALGAVLLTAVLWLPAPTAIGYSYKPREVRVRTTAYTHSESDHLAYGRKTAIGTNLKFTRDYTSAASDWSRFPVGTEFRIKGLNRHFVIDDYGSALVGKDTIDLYFTSKTDMNRWGARYVDVIVTKYGDYEKSKKILSQRTKWRHCRKMLTGIKENGEKSKGTEQYEKVPALDFEIDKTLLAAASIPKSEWSKSAPTLIRDTRQPKKEIKPKTEPKSEPKVQIAKTDSPPAKVPAAKPIEVAKVTKAARTVKAAQKISQPAKLHSPVPTLVSNPIPARSVEVAMVTGFSKSGLSNAFTTVSDQQVIEPPLPPDSEWAGPIRAYALRRATVHNAVFVKPAPRTTITTDRIRRSFRKVPTAGTSTSSGTVSGSNKNSGPPVNSYTAPVLEKKAPPSTPRQVPKTYRKPRTFRPL